jgi:hypothetical protein
MPPRAGTGSWTGDGTCPRPEATTRCAGAKAKVPEGSASSAGDVRAPRSRGGACGLITHARQDRAPAWGELSRDPRGRPQIRVWLAPGASPRRWGRWRCRCLRARRSLAWRGHGGARRWQARCSHSRRRAPQGGHESPWVTATVVALRTVARGDVLLVGTSDYGRA